MCGRYAHTKDAPSTFVLVCALILGAGAATALLLPSVVSVPWSISVTAEGVAALATSLGLIYTWHRDRMRRDDSDRRRLDRAACLAVGFHHELSILYTQSVDFPQVLRGARRPWLNALDVSIQFLENSKAPLLMKMVSRLDDFDGEASVALMRLATGLLRAKETPTSRGLVIRHLPPEIARAMTHATLRDIRVLKRDTLSALMRIDPYVRRYVSDLPTIDELVSQERRTFVVPRAMTRSATT